MKPLNVTIVGGGIGGLSAAIALQMAGHSAHVYERAPELLPIGAGICLWPNGGMALNALGLCDAIEEASPIMRTLSYRDKAGAELRRYSLEVLAEKTGQRPYPLARHDLHDALIDRLGREHVTLNSECVSVTQDEGSAEVTFKDGTRVESDLIIGADGVRSLIRGHVAPGFPTLGPYYISSFGIVLASLNLTPSDTFTFHVADNKRVGLLDVGKDRTYYFVDTPYDPVELEMEDQRATLKEHFADWFEPIHDLIDAMSPNAPRQAIGDIDELPSYFNGRIALLGDAAHATTPMLGQGAAMGLEDSLVLGRHLATAPDLETALALYDAERRPRATSVVMGARARMQAMMGVVPDSAEEWYRQLLEDVKSQDFIDTQMEIAATVPYFAY